MAGTQSDPDDIITDINVTPLVDIILVLLIIFMLTANIIARPSIEVELPEASTGEGTEPTTLAISITKDGEIFLNGAPTDEDKLRAYLPEVLEADPKTQAIIAADKEVTHGQVVHIIDLVRQGGIFKFALNIEPTGESVAPAP
ncbi:ExbD/TolR family protein [Myxococcota bacterium]